MKKSTNETERNKNVILTAHSESLISETKRGVLSHPDIQCTRRPLSSV